MFPSPGYVVWMLGGLWADGNLSAASSLTIWEQISAACCCLSGHLHRRRSGVWWRGRGGVQSLDINIQNKSVKLAKTDENWILQIKSASAALTTPGQSAACVAVAARAAAPHAAN